MLQRLQKRDLKVPQKGKIDYALRIENRNILMMLAMHYRKNYRDTQTSSVHP